MNYPDSPTMSGSRGKVTLPPALTMLNESNSGRSSPVNLMSPVAGPLSSPPTLSPSHAQRLQASLFTPTAAVGGMQGQFMRMMPLVMTVRELAARQWASHSFAAHFRWQLPLGDRSLRHRALEALLENAQKLDDELALREELRNFPGKKSVKNQAPNPCAGVDVARIGRAERLEMVLAPVATFKNANIRETKSVRQLGIAPEIVNMVEMQKRSETVLQSSGTLGDRLLSLLSLSPRLSKKMLDKTNKLSHNTPQRITSQYFKLVFSLLYSMFLAPPLSVQEKEQRRARRRQQHHRPSSLGDSGSDFGADPLVSDDDDARVDSMGNVGFIAMELASADWMQTVSQSGKAFEELSRRPKKALLDIMTSFFFEILCTSGDFVLQHRSLLYLSDAQWATLLDEGLTPPHDLKKERDKLFSSFHSFLVLVNEVLHTIRHSHVLKFREALFTQKAQLVNEELHGLISPSASRSFEHVSQSNSLQAGDFSLGKSAELLSEEDTQLIQGNDMEGLGEAEDMTDLFHPSFKVFVDGKPTIVVPEAGSSTGTRLMQAAKLRASASIDLARAQVAKMKKEDTLAEKAQARREALWRLGGKLPSEDSQQHFVVQDITADLSRLLDRRSGGFTMKPKSFFERVADDTDLQVKDVPLRRSHTSAGGTTANYSVEDPRAGVSSAEDSILGPRAKSQRAKTPGMMHLRDKQFSIELVRSYRNQERSREEGMLHEAKGFSEEELQLAEMADEDASPLSKVWDETNLTITGISRRLSEESLPEFPNVEELSMLTSGPIRGRDLAVIQQSRDLTTTELPTDLDETRQYAGQNEVTEPPTSNSVLDLLEDLDREKAEKAKEERRAKRRAEREKKRAKVVKRDLEGTLNRRVEEKKKKLPELPQAHTVEEETLRERELDLTGASIDVRSGTLRRFRQFAEKFESERAARKREKTREEVIADRKKAAFLKSLPPEIRVFGYV